MYFSFGTFDLKKINQEKRKCFNPACRRRAEPEVHFCDSCLTGMLDGKVSVFEMGLVRRGDLTWDRGRKIVLS